MVERWTSRYMKLIGSPQKFNPKRISLRYMIIKLKNKKETFENNKSKGNSLYTRAPPQSYQWISQMKPYRSEESEVIYSKC